MRDVFLIDVADELTVGYVGSMATEYVDDGIPFLRSLNVEPFRINRNDLKFITPEFHQRIQKSRLSTGDVVIVRTGKPGACSVVPEWLTEANCSDLVIIRCSKELNNRFLAYYVNSAASDHVAAHLVGAVQQHFNVGSARTLRLRLPPLPEQTAIARAQGSLDDKIELNRRMNETLEGLARAIFQSSFVDFDPVRALRDGLPRPLHSHRRPLPRQLRGLRSRQDSQWMETGRIVDCCEKSGNGGTPNRDVFDYSEPGTVPWLTSGEVRQSIVISTVNFISQRGLENSSAKMWPAWTTVVALYGATAGQRCLVATELCANQACCGLIAKPHRRFFNYLLLSSSVPQLEQQARGSAQQNLSKQIVEDMPSVSSFLRRCSGFTGLGFLTP